MVHTPDEWEGTEREGTFFQPTFFTLLGIPVGCLCSSPKSEGGEKWLHPALSRFYPVTPLKPACCNNDIWVAVWKPKNGRF